MVPSDLQVDLDPRLFHGREDIVTEPLADAVDMDNFTPRLLHLLSNALVRRESRLLRQRFNLGTNDWRVLSALAVRPGLAANEVVEFIEVNKAIVSKSVNTLAERDLIMLIDGPRGTRPMYLTASGAEMHQAMMPVSMAGKEIILSDLPPQEVASLNAVLRGMIARTADF